MVSCLAGRAMENHTVLPPSFAESCLHRSIQGLVVADIGLNAPSRQSAGLWKEEGRQTLCFTAAILAAQMPLLMDDVSHTSSILCEDAEQIFITILLLLYVLHFSSFYPYLFCAYVHVCCLKANQHKFSCATLCCKIANNRPLCLHVHAVTCVLVCMRQYSM